MLLSFLCDFLLYCRDFMRGQHVDPEEAVKVHQDVRSQKSVGIHWGTFDLALEVR